VIAYLAWVAVGQTSGARAVLALLGALGVRGCAAGVAARAWRRVEWPRLKRAWGFLSLSLSCWALADLYVALTWLAAASLPPVPSWVDFFRLGGYFAVTAAILGYPVAPAERFGRVRDLLDLAIIATAVMTLSWLVFIQPMLVFRLIAPVQVYWRALYPVFDLVLLALFLRLSLLTSSPSDRSVLRYLSLGTLCLAFSDLAMGVMALQDRYLPGSLIEAGWLVSSGLYIAAAERLAVGTPRAPPAPRAGRGTARRMEALLPIALAGIVVGYLVIDWWLAGQVNWVGVGAAALLGVLLVTRQGVIAGQVELRQHASLVNNTADMAFICQVDGMLRLINPALLHAVGLDQEPQTSINLSDLMTDDRQSERILSEAMQAGWSGEVTLQRMDGATFPAYLSLRPVHDELQSQPVLAGTAHDLTSIKRREEELHTALNEVAAARTELEALNVALEEKVEARTCELESMVADLAQLNEELQELDALKTEFVALVSHELRGPLTNIRIGVELLLNNYPDLTSSVCDSLNLVQAETERLATFVGTILDISALEAGRFPLRPIPLTLEQVARQVCTRFPEFAGGERLHLDIPADLPAVYADERGLSSTLFHLLDNALKYAPEGEVRVEAQVDGSKVNIAVIDCGPGIPPEERERVFETFHRLDASDSKEVYGYGLGLPIAKRFLEAMGGEIRVEDAAGGGAKLVFWLPRVQ